MKKLYLHIGLHKTGTSSIQKLVVGNPELLVSSGIAAPEFLGRDDGAHHLWVKGLHESPDGLPRLLAALESLDAPRLLVSSETLSHYLLDPANARLLASALRKRFDTTVIIYLRRQDFLKESVYSQIVKTTYTGPITHPNIYHLAFNIRMAILDQSFGRKNVTARIYRDDVRFDAVAEFRRLLGISEQVPNENSSESRVNVALPRRKVMLLGEISKVGKSAAFIRSLVDCVRASSAIRDDGYKFILSPEQRSKLVAKYAVGNAALCRRYGLVADADYFCDSSESREDWAPAEPISAAERDAVMGEIAAWTAHAARLPA